MGLRPGHCSRKADQDLLERRDMRMLRWMMGIKRIEKIRREEIGTRTGVANIIREMRMLRWMMGIKRIEKIRREEIGTRTGVANIIREMRMLR